MNETWFDCDHIPHSARDARRGSLCEECEPDTPAVAEVRWWEDDGGGSRDLCQACYEKLRADPHHNPKGGYADAYVSLGEAL